MCQRASELKKVQRLLGASRAALGSLSEACAVFDPAILRGAIHELVGELRGKQKLPRELKGLTAVDGTFLRAVPRMAWALFRTNEKYRGVKAHVLFDVELAAPIDASLTAARASEKTELRNKLEARSILRVGRRIRAIQALCRHYRRGELIRLSHS